jgi:hypothetical protein
MSVSILVNPMQPMKLLSILVLSVILSLLGHAADAPFTCVIASSRTTYTAGEMPKISVRITNHTSKEVYLIGSLDGCTSKSRFPGCDFELLDATGLPILKAKPGVGCGNTNPLKQTDFVKVAPGKDFDPYGEGFFPSLVIERLGNLSPGTYILRFHYFTTAELVNFFGDERMKSPPATTPEIEKLFELVPQIELTSNDLQITIQPK